MRTDASRLGGYSYCARDTFLSLIHVVKTSSNATALARWNLAGKFGGACLASGNVTVPQCFEGLSPRCC